MRSHGDYDPQWWAYHHATEAAAYLLLGREYWEDAADQALAALSVLAGQHDDLEGLLEAIYQEGESGLNAVVALTRAGEAVLDRTWTKAAALVADALTTYPLGSVYGYAYTDDLREPLGGEDKK